MDSIIKKLLYDEHGNRTYIYSTRLLIRDYLAGKRPLPRRLKAWHVAKKFKEIKEVEKG